MTPNQLPTRPEVGVYLWCKHCGESYSATRGDYFLQPEDKPLRCCGRLLLLVREEITRRVVTS